MRFSLFGSIVIGCALFVLIIGGIGWLALYRQDAMTTTIISLYDTAFEGVNYAHKAREDPTSSNTYLKLIRPNATKSASKKSTAGMTADS
jgi:hypothetical protein